MMRPTVVRMLGLGKKIKRFRTDANITQRKMAKLLGIPYSTYSNYENDNRTPDTDTLGKICDILHISMSDLIGPVVGPMGNSVFVPDPEKAARGYRLNRLDTAFYELNEEGQNEAIKRVEELTEIPRYRRQDTPPAGTPSEETPTERT